MNVLIFADVHLRAGPAGKATQAEFVQFLRSIDPAKYERIVILGDLFDFWFEYRHVIFSSYFESLRALADLRDGGAELHLVCGNHDFWAGRFLESELGMHVHPVAYETQLGDRRVMFVHGDGVNKRDYGYRVYKQIARARPVIALFRLLHPDWAMGVAQAVSHGSRTLLSPDDPATSHETRAVAGYARGILESGRADVVVCAHTHHPMREVIPRPSGDGLYLNTGDWMLNRHYLLWEEDEFTGRQFENT